MDSKHDQNETSSDAAPLSSPHRPTTKWIVTFTVPVLLACIIGLIIGWNPFYNDGVSASQQPAPQSNQVDAGSLAQPRRVANRQSAKGQLIPDTGANQSHCPEPVGWMPYQVSANDTLKRLSITYGIPVDNLLQANCLAADYVILPGQTIFVPMLHQDLTSLLPTPSPEPTKRPVPANAYVQAVTADEEQSPPAANPGASQPQQPRSPAPAPTAVTPNQPAQPPAQPAPPAVLPHIVIPPVLQNPPQPPSIKPPGGTGNNKGNNGNGKGNNGNGKGGGKDKNNNPGGGNGKNKGKK